jgi:hypothetical protein
MLETGEDVCWRLLLLLRIIIFFNRLFFSLRWCVENLVGSPHLRTEHTVDHVLMIMSGSDVLQNFS